MKQTEGFLSQSKYAEHQNVKGYIKKVVLLVALNKRGHNYWLFVHSLFLQSFAVPPITGVSTFGLVESEIVNRAHIQPNKNTIK